MEPSITETENLKIDRIDIVGLDLNKLAELKAYKHPEYGIAAQMAHEHAIDLAVQLILTGEFTKTPVEVKG